MSEIFDGNIRVRTFVPALSIALGLCSALALNAADGLSGSVAEYRKTGRVAAFAESRGHADRILSADDAEVSPSDLASLLELSR